MASGSQDPLGSQDPRSVCGSHSRHEGLIPSLYSQLLQCYLTSRLQSNNYFHKPSYPKQPHRYCSSTHTVFLLPLASQGCTRSTIAKKMDKSIFCIWTSMTTRWFIIIFSFNPELIFLMKRNYSVTPKQNKTKNKKGKKEKKRLHTGRATQEAKKHHWYNICSFAAWLRSMSWAHTCVKLMFVHLLLSQLALLLVPVRYCVSMDFTSWSCPQAAFTLRCPNHMVHQNRKPYWAETAPLPKHK